MLTPEYILRMEIEFRENHKRYTDGSAYLEKQRVLRDTSKQPIEAGAGAVPLLACGSDRESLEMEMLQDQLYSMASYLRTLGSRIAFAKAKEGVV